ncbi:MAG TPA: DUF5818 domain-containing protein [Terriglobales bacterium]|nr:DUF5818 domain-containing protein [Terriglobales bacterium]
MKKIQFALSTLLPAMALTVVLCLASHPVLAQSQSGSSPDASSQQPMPPDTQAAPEKIFSGKVVKSGDKLVLKANGTTYQLDDQQKAQDFLNKSVKVTGVLDASTGTIRVSAIDPA